MAELVREMEDGHALVEPGIKLRLSREETLVLWESMRGMWTGQFDQYGGVEEFIRRLRSDEPLAL